MKKFYMLLIVLFAFTGFSMAQTIENFESIKMNTFDIGANGSVSVVPNPDTTGINKSLYVGKMVRGMDGQPWAGWYSVLTTPIDVTANKYVHLKVWKPRITPVVFKYEQGAVNSGDVFSMTPQTQTDQWEELVFDMSVVSGEYLQIVLIPDFETPLTLTEDITLYFDDIYANNDPAVGSEAVVIFEDFEPITLNLLSGGEEDLSTMTVVPNPDQSPLNSSDYVVEFLRDKDAPVWAGFWSPLTDTIDVTTNKYVHVKVWKPRVSILKFKIEGGDAGTIEIASMSPQTKTEEWEDIVFDFSEKTGTYPIIAFLADFEDPLTLTEDITLYFDDIILNNDPAAMIPPVQVFNVDMNTSGMTTGSKVWISGTLGGVHGTWAQPGTVPENEMLDTDGDGIYTITLNLPDGLYEYKFFWGDNWNNGDPVAGGNRKYTITGDAVLSHVWNVAGVTTAVKDLSEQAFKVFPNPVSNMLTIQSANMKRVVVSDLLGRAVKNVKLQALNSTKIDLGDLQSGMYIISVETSNGTFTSKFRKE
ncbi:MAG TPA: T9SS type A sorting domain-containing protein [Prolixibacteraceae bacterium]|nr:T9SS type A sorting domain-containing protein [Prolixibacteraceae bacterium]